MSGSVDAKRQALMGLYGSTRVWRIRVKGMSEGQVIAIYLRLKKEGKL